MTILMPTKRRTSRRPPVQPLEWVDVQTSYPLLAVLGTAIFAVLVWTWVAGPHIVRTLLLPALGWAMVCFCTLRICVTEGCLSWQFGPGWIRGRVPLSEMVTTHIVMSPWAYGWGFHRTIWGWRFHRGGALALEIHCRNGKRLRLGTTRAHELQHLIESASGRRHCLS